MKKFFNILFVSLTLLLLPLLAKAECNIVIDGKEFVCHDANGNMVSPFIENGTTYVPVRAIATAFDTTVEWEQETKTVYIGKKSGSPILGEQINIFSQGEAFICRDANGNEVFPILRDGSTYLPLRGIANLFGKLVSWDNQNRTAVLISPPSESSVNYLVNAISNTANMKDLVSIVTFEGTMYHDGYSIATAQTSGTESYTPGGFSLFTVLPQGYESSIAYLGEGEYFLNVSSSVFYASPYVQKALFKRGSSSEMSPLYIFISTKGGYITEIDIHCTSTLVYNNEAFPQVYSINAILSYPENFAFPLIPHPSLEDIENSVPLDAGENSDSLGITTVIREFFNNATSYNATALTQMLYSADYSVLYGKKSKTQLNLDMNNLTKLLNTKFAACEGTYKISSMVYTDYSEFDHSPENAAKVTLIIPTNKEDISLEVVLVKINGKWYIHPISILSL